MTAWCVPPTCQDVCWGRFVWSRQGPDWGDSVPWPCGVSVQRRQRHDSSLSEEWPGASASDKYRREQGSKPYLDGDHIRRQDHHRAVPGRQRQTSRTHRQTIGLSVGSTFRLRQEGATFMLSRALTWKTMDGRDLLRNDQYSRAWPAPACPRDARREKPHLFVVSAAVDEVMGILVSLGSDRNASPGSACRRCLVG